MFAHWSLGLRSLGLGSRTVRKSISKNESPLALRNRRRELTRTLLIEGLENRNLLASVPLVNNLSTTPVDADVVDQTSIGNTAYYWNNNLATGKTDLWASDGNSGGTSIVKSFQSFGGGDFAVGDVVIGTTIYFPAFNPANNREFEIWSSTGTPGGTNPLLPGGPSNAANFVNVNGTLYFTATNPADNTFSLYKSNATLTGASVVKVLSTNTGDRRSISGVAVGSRLYFVFDDGSGTDSLWFSDGAPATTKVVRTIASGGPTSPTNLTALGTKVFFKALDPNTSTIKFWSSDGTAANTKAIAGGPSLFSDTSELVVVGNLFYASGFDSDFINSIFVYSSTTNTISRLNNSAGVPITNPILETGSVIGGTIYFGANSDFGQSLYKSTGTSATTTLVDNTGKVSDPSTFRAVGSTLYFKGYDVYGTSGIELWKTDGSSQGTLLVSDIVPGLESSEPTLLMAAGSRLTFWATTPSQGFAPWTSDVATGVTKLVRRLDSRDVGTAFNDSSVTVNGFAYLGANISQTGPSLVKTDGTVAGTTIITGLPDSPNHFFNFNGNILFNSGGRIWITNGTQAGTRRATSDSGPILSGDPKFTQMGSVVYFLASSGSGPSTGFELWRTDGTANGTRLVRDIAPGPGSSNPGFQQNGVTNFVVSVTTLFFAATNPALGTNELYKSNGTFAGTTIVQTGGPTDIRDIVLISGRVYFTGFSSTDNRYYLYYTDGVTITTVKPSITNPYSIDNISTVTLVALPNKPLVYFPASPSEGNPNLWESDGTSINTRPIFAPTEPQPTNINDLVTVNGRLWFTATNPADNQNTVYTSDGSKLGTLPLRAIGSGGPTNASQFRALNGFVYFSGTTVAGGTELWRSDGTAAGTVQVADIYPGLDSFGTPFSSTPRILGAAGNNLVFYATNSANAAVFSTFGANELYFLPNAPTVVTGLPTLPLNYETAGPALPVSPTIAIAPAAIVTDPNTNYANTRLTVSITGGGTGDILAITNQGILSGQVGISTVLGVTSVTFGNVVVGTVTDGTNITPLAVRFNTAVTQASLQAIVRAIMFTNNLNPPTFTTRTISIAIVNGLGAPAVPGIVSVVLNSRPIVSSLNPSSIYQATGTAVPRIINSTSSIADVNGNFAGGILSVTPVSGATASDNLVIQPQSTVGAVLTLSSSVISFNGIPVASVSGGVGTTPLTVTFNTPATISTAPSVQAIIKNVAFVSNSATPTPGNRTYQFRFTDGGGLASAAVPAGTVVVNAPTTISTPALGSSPAFSVSSGVPVQVGPTVDLTDPNGDFGNSLLTVAISANADAADQLLIANQGTLNGQIGIMGISVTFSGAVVASFTGGTATTPLSVTFGPSANQAIVRALLRSLQFNNPSATMGVATRSIQFSIRDGNGLIGPATIGQVLINPAPTFVGIPTTSTYNVNGSAVALAPTATITGATANFASSSLLVTITNGTTFDRFAVRNVGIAAGQVGVSGANVTFGGVVIGTLSVTTATSPLTITFNASATQAAVQAVLNNTLFSIATGLPTTTGRIVQLRFIDRLGAVSPIVSTTVNVNAAPVFGGIVTALAYNRGTAGIAIAPSGTVTDSGNQHSASTLLIRNTNGEATDTLTLRNVGTAAGQVATFGNAVFVSGVLAGTLTGGTGTTMLSIVFVTGTSQATINKVLNNVLFSTASTASTINRIVSYQLRDTLGAINTSFLQTIVMNQAPVLVGIGSTVSYSSVAATPVLLVPPTASITNVDGDFANSILAVDLSTTGNSGDRLSVRNQGTTTGLVGIVISGTTTSVTFGGVIMGTLTGGTSVVPLRIQFNSAATSASVTAVLRNLTFVTTTPTPASRTIRFSITDGGGLPSTVVSQSLTIT